MIDDSVALRLDRERHVLVTDRWGEVPIRGRTSESRTSR